MSGFMSFIALLLVGSAAAMVSMPSHSSPMMHSPKMRHSSPMMYSPKVAASCEPCLCKGKPTASPSFSSPSYKMTPTASKMTPACKMADQTCRDSATKVNKCVASCRNKYAPKSEDLAACICACEPTLKTTEAACKPYITTCATTTKRQDSLTRADAYFSKVCSSVKTFSQSGVYCPPCDCGVSPAADLATTDSSPQMYSPYSSPMYSPKHSSPKHSSPEYSSPKHSSPYYSSPTHKSSSKPSSSMHSPSY